MKILVFSLFLSDVLTIINGQDQCQCNGAKSTDGKGGPACDSIHQGKEYCYTSPGVCSDGVTSGQLSDTEWSYLACAQDQEIRYSAVRLIFTKNHDADAVCVENFKLFLKGKEINWPDSTTVSDTGSWDNKYIGKNLLPGIKSYYCSEKRSFANSKAINDDGTEKVTVSMPTSVEFDEYSLQQSDDMDYNPRDFTLEAKEEGSNNWITISIVKDFDFPKKKAVEHFSLEVLVRNPTRNPTRSPTRSPTKRPTRSPTQSPTRKPKNPTRIPTRTTTSPSRSPTRVQTPSPTKLIMSPITTNPTTTPGIAKNEDEIQNEFVIPDNSESQKSPSKSGSGTVTAVFVTMAITACLACCLFMFKQKYDEDKNTIGHYLGEHYLPEPFRRSNGNAMHSPLLMNYNDSEQNDIRAFS